MSVAKTIVGGIQELSALLPLLGTDQCEEHTGSALSSGYCYIGITPASIFGSLGIAKAGFNVLISSITIPSLRILGAETLANGGFQPKGKVAPMIALDPQSTKRFLAESRLQKLLEDEHIENVEDLSVEWDEGTLRWNIFMIVCTIVGASLGITPYIFAIFKVRDEGLFLRGWPFPIARLIGCALTGITVQVVIQIRVMTIIKTRLLFLAVDRKMKEMGIRDSIAEVVPWHKDKASETCLWSLQRYLASNLHPQDQQHSNQGPEFSISTELSEVPSRHTSVKVVPSDLTPLARYLKSETKRHFQPTSSGLKHVLLPVILAAGIFLSIAGYIGSFYLIQNTPYRTLAPFLWLILEVVLCVLRMIIWAWNPGWDDSKGIHFELKLAPHCPLVTCDLYGDDIERSGVAPVVRSKVFLKEVAAYTGPVPSFTWDDTALYYILTGDKAPSDSSHGSKILYLVISDFKEQTSRVLVKRDRHRTHMDIYVSNLVPDPRSTIISVNTAFTAPIKHGKYSQNYDDSTGADTHFLTSNASFMKKIGAHYDDVMERFSQNASRKAAYFHKSWSLEPISISRPFEALSEGDKVDFGLTREDILYLELGQLKRRCSHLRTRLGEWTELYSEMLASEFLEDVPLASHVPNKDEPITIVQRLEANEVEFLIIWMCRQMESYLQKTLSAWEAVYMRRNRDMIADVLSGLYPKENIQDGYSAETLGLWRRELEHRLNEEERKSLAHESQSAKDDMHKRLHRQLENSRSRIGARKYKDPQGRVIIQRWETLHSRIGVDSGIDYTRMMENRLQRASNNLGELIQGDEEGNRFKTYWRGELDKMHDRWRSRDSLLQARLKLQSLELQDSEEEAFISDLSDEWEHKRSYWSLEAVQERIRLSDRQHKFVKIMPSTCTALGGLQNVYRALERSQDFSFIDLKDISLDDADTQKIAGVIRRLGSVTGFSSEQPSNAIANAVQENIEICSVTRDVCSYDCVEVDDAYRKDHPYLLFNHPGKSACTLKFRVRELEDHILTLCHCVTTSKGRVNIRLNGDEITNRTWGMAYSVQANFQNEEILLPKASLKLAPLMNKLEIRLGPKSPGAYWLSNVFLPVRKRVTQKKNI